MPIHLAADEAHIWITDPSSGIHQENPTPFLGLLSVEERERYHKFLFEPDRLLYLTAHAQIRSLLSLYDEDIGAADWTFSTNHYGRPEIAGPHRGSPLRFNLSHTRGCVVSAFTRGRAVGIDVENRERKVDALAVARHSFAPREVQDVEALSGEKLRSRFFEYWTLKEAFIKAHGKGLSIPLKDFWFGTRGREIEVNLESRDLGSAKEWQFEQFQPTPQHQAALAVQVQPGEKLQVVVRQFRL